MSILSFILPLIGLIIFLKIISLPFKIIAKFIFNSIIGGIILAICFHFGIIVAVYWWTIVLTGLFGVPGFVIATIIAFLI